jgi:glycosyl hydrolase family 39 (putative alpha-L-iduronidase)
MRCERCGTEAPLVGGTAVCSACDAASLGLSRRDFLAGAGALGLAALGDGSLLAGCATTMTPPVLTLEDSAQSAAAALAGPQGPLYADDFRLCGVWSADLFLLPDFQRLLDMMAASPGAFKAVRFFGALSSGNVQRAIAVKPDAGNVWPHPDTPPDFSVTLDALYALTSRELVPFVGLNFFPQAVSPAPTTPPATFDRWQRLVRALLDAIAADARFGAAAMRTWWFEVWNEPDGGGFWAGTVEQYLELYAATSSAVRASGYDIRLGGPAVADGGIAPDSVAPFMERFLQFLASHPEVKCDFLSLHAKGVEGAGTTPNLRRTVSLGEAVARRALALDATRFAGMTIVDDEADMKVGFNTPFEPRMNERFPAWMAALLVAHAGLSARYTGHDLRFVAAADDLNLELVRAPFDGRRSILTRASRDPNDLFKLAIFGYYEILRLLGDRHGSFVRGGEHYYPRDADLFHLISVADTHITALFALYPRGDAHTSVQPVHASYDIGDIPWPRVNVARFVIDQTHSNSYTAFGGQLGTAATPLPDAARAQAIRQAQELAVAAPIQRDLPLPGGKFSVTVSLAPYAVLVYWLTPFRADAPAPAAPAWLHVDVEGGNVVLRWQPNREADFYSYEVFVLASGAQRQIAPVPLRGAIWVDTAPPPGERNYAVRAVNASGSASALVRSATVKVG